MKYILTIITISLMFSCTNQESGFLYEEPKNLGQLLDLEHQFFDNPPKLEYQRKEFKGNQRVTHFYHTQIDDNFSIKIWNSFYDNNDVMAMLKVIRHDIKKPSIFLTRNKTKNRIDLSIKTKFRHMYYSDEGSEIKSSYHDGDSEFLTVSFEDTDIIILYIQQEPKACFEITKTHEIIPPSEHALKLLKKTLIE